MFGARLPICLVLLSSALAGCSADQGNARASSDMAGNAQGGASGGSERGGSGGLSLAGSAGRSLPASGAAGAEALAGSGGLSEPGSGGASAGADSGGTVGQAGKSGGEAGAAAGGNTFSPCPVGSPCAVLPLGDSITEGFGSSGGGYRVELFREALQNGKSLTFVGNLQNGPSSVDNHPFPKSHEGHGGFTIDSGTGYSGISGAITDQALANYHPNIVLLMIGTNDINGNIDVAAAPTRLGKLIDDITTRAPNALLIVATIIPVDNEGTNSKVKTYDAAIPGIVGKRAAAGKHVALVDNYAAFSKDPNYRATLMFNYLHPNDAGYEVLGRSFYGAISAALR